MELLQESVIENSHHGLITGMEQAISKNVHCFISNQHGCKDCLMPKELYIEFLKEVLFEFRKLHLSRADCRQTNAD